MKPNKIENQNVRDQESSVWLKIPETDYEAATEMEKHRLKELHWMHCPKCGQNLTTEQFGPVEVDLCPSCRGLWLDSKELETMVESKSGFLRSCLKSLLGY